MTPAPDLASAPAPTPLDTRGRPITPARLRRAMLLNITLGIMGAAWFTVCSPQQIFTVFYKNDLGTSAGELGWLVAFIQFAAICNLAAIFIYNRAKTRKPIWIAAQVLHRTFGFVLAGVSVWAAHAGADKSLGAKIIAAAMVVSWILSTSTASAWWSWMADLVPESIRGHFFGRRATTIRLINTLWFLAITLALDHIKVVSVFYVYAAVFALGGLAGVIDIACHILMPEPAKGRDVPRLGWREFTEPLRNRNFLSFSLGIGAWSFAASVLGPFVAPYVTADPAQGGLGAPMTWLGINATLAQIVMMLTGTQWGIVMDRFGRKPTTLLGSIHPLISWASFFFMTRANYPYILVATGLVTGLLASAFWDGSAQLMLTLTPPKNRNAYISWHLALAAIIASGGSVLGGYLSDALHGFHAELWSGFTIGGFHIVALVSFALSLLSVFLLARIREGREKPVGYVVSRLFTPGIFRTFLNLGAISSAARSGDTVRALRTLDGASSHLAVADVVDRLGDPDPLVREEAARTLGRIGADDAVDPLVGHLRDADSTIRPEAAQALGQLGDPRAVPALREGLADPLPEVRSACAEALDRIDRPRPPEPALRTLRTLDADAVADQVPDILAHLADPDPLVREEAALALGRAGSPDAVDALVRCLRDPASTIRPEAAQALGQIGDPRAVPALIEGLSIPSPEVQDACARALGDIGGRESVHHLLGLLKDDRTEQVVASGAEAVSKHGILEAAWEILPRMHRTRNAVLRRQLAIAMGNLLGRPGEFYGTLTNETARQGSRLGRLCRGARRAVRSVARGLPRRSPDRATLATLETDLRTARNHLEAQAYRTAVEDLYAIILRLARLALRRPCSDDVILEYAFARDAKLGLGLWFAREVGRRAGRTRDAELLHLDALLALYFLSAYRLPPESAPND